jgi:hypothetical protein
MQPALYGKHFPSGEREARAMCLEAVWHSGFSWERRHLGLRRPTKLLMFTLFTTTSGPFALSLSKGIAPRSTLAPTGSARTVCGVAIYVTLNRRAA